jgi:hypothetical protein
MLGLSDSEGKGKEEVGCHQARSLKCSSITREPEAKLKIYN